MFDQFLSQYRQIPYDESNWASFSIAEKDQKSSRKLQCEGRYARTLIEDVLGWSEIETSPGGLTLRRYPPEKHPRFSWHRAREGAFIREVLAPTNSGPGATLEYKGEEFQFDYQAMGGVRLLSDEERPAGLLGELWRYVSRKTTSNVLMQGLKAGALRYNFDDSAIGEGTGQLVTSRTNWITWFQIPCVVAADGIISLPGRLQTTIDETVGTMNSDAFDGKNKQTLLLMDPTYEYFEQSNGKLAANITFIFNQRGGPDLTAVPFGDETDSPDFSRILDMNTGRYRRVYRASDATKVRSIYDAKPYNRLFKFD